MKISYLMFELESSSLLQHALVSADYFIREYLTKTNIAEIKQFCNYSLQLVYCKYYMA